MVNKYIYFVRQFGMRPTGRANGIEKGFSYLSEIKNKK